ncbi:MAG: hypothetical protein ACP5I8_14435 [Phycisphaerae bacterium]
MRVYEFLTFRCDGRYNGRIAGIAIGSLANFILTGERMAKLFTYTIKIDDGAAPNPFHGLCTLVICKPAIRRCAKAGDWVVGLNTVCNKIAVH